MFANIVAALHAIFSVEATAMSIVVDGPDVPSHTLAVSYLDGLGRRQADTPNDDDWGRETRHSTDQEIFQIAMYNNTCASLLLMGKPNIAARSCELALQLAQDHIQQSDVGDGANGYSEMLATIFGTLGVVSAVLGNETMASHRLSEAYKIDKDFAAARHNLSTLEKRTQSFVNAQYDE